MSSPSAAGTDGVAVSGLTRFLDRSYVAGLWLKALLGVTQLLAAVSLFLAGRQGFAHLVARITSGELREDPADPFANWLMGLVTSTPHGTEAFYLLYLGAHGLLNLGAALALFARLRGATAATVAVLSAFVLYQIYRFVLAPSALLVALTALDLLIIALAIRDYRQDGSPLLPARSRR